MLVGINLLREGLDIPEVSLVAILDADKEGFLRSERSLIQTIGRAARNLNGRAILYADRITDSMRRALDETERRRNKQLAFNAEHGITPRGVAKKIRELIDGVVSDKARDAAALEPAEVVEALSEKELGKRIQQLGETDVRTRAQSRVRKGRRVCGTSWRSSKSSCSAPVGDRRLRVQLDFPPGKP